jgi:4-hydroxy-2-oxoheptanedioate aldolase
MQMRSSRVLQKLRADKIISCMKINLSCPRVVEIAAMMGFDCIWLDMEHVPTDWATIENQVRAAKAHDVDTVIRVARGSYSDYIRPLELDGTGIMVPHIMGLEDARRVIWQTRFHPLGRRAFDGGNGDGAYGMVNTPEYVKGANRERFIVVQIEDPEPLAQLDEIAQLDGIDMIFFGPGDFSHSIGRPGEITSTEVVDARRRVADACRLHGKFAGTIGTIQNLPELTAMGYRFISLGADVLALRGYFREIVEAVRSYA